MVYIFITLFGLALGSFVNALVWRLHEQSKKKSRFNNADLSILKGRSMCPQCGHQLHVLDLVPVLSWLSLLGKCRYCKKAISWEYPLFEVIFTFLLVISYNFWPYDPGNNLFFFQFGIWILLLTTMMALAVYDLKWMILPTRLVRLAMALSVLLSATVIADEGDFSVVISSLIGSVALGGLFWLIYQISDGKWIGGGDVRLGFAMGLLLGWQKTLLSLSLAAYIGTLIAITALILGKYSRKMKLPFGPLLIAGWYISFIWGQQAINWYLNLVLI